MKTSPSPISPTLPLQQSAATYYRTKATPRLRLSMSFPERGKTKQEFKDECDINVIMGRYQKTGILPQDLNQKMPHYADVTGYDFQQAMQTVAQARSLFEALPSDIRARFENDPAKLLDFVHDPSNRAESLAMGFLDPEALARLEVLTDAQQTRPERSFVDLDKPKPPPAEADKAAK